MTNSEREIRERIEKATKGPWCCENVCEKGYGVAVGVAFSNDDLHCKTPLTGWPQFYDEEGDDIAMRDEAVCMVDEMCVNHTANADFLAHAREDIPYLLTALDATRRDLAEAKEIMIDLIMDGIRALTEEANEEGTDE